MNISCNSCGKVHSVPEESIKNKKIYFYCSSCSHKIVVDTRHETTHDFITLHKNMKYTELFTGLFSFFSWPALLISALSGILGIILLGSCAAIFASNLTLFMESPGASIFFGLIVFLLLYYGRNMLLYYNSKLILYKYTHPEKKHLDWKDIHFDFGEDWLTVLLYSCSIVASLFILGLPIPFLKGFGILYSGLFFPVFILLTLTIVLVIILGRYIPAILASGSFFVKEGIKEIANFVKDEFVEIPFYSILILLISKFFIIIFSTLFAGVVGITLGFIAVMLSPEARAQAIQYLGSIAGAGFGSGSEVASHISLGGVIFFVMLGLVIVLFTSFCDLFIQSLFAKAVHIMKVNPKTSFDRVAMLIILALAILFTLLGVIILSTLVSGSLNSLLKLI